MISRPTHDVEHLVAGRRPRATGTTASRLASARVRSSVGVGAGVGSYGPVRPGLARPLRDELQRDHLIERLAERWNRRVTLVVAPGGFGKSTAIAQAIADNDVDPSGFDVYLRLGREHSEARSIAAALAAAMTADGVQDDGLAPADAVVHAVLSRSPTTVCLHLDDVHEVAGDDGTVELLAELIRLLPANGRVLLAGRSLPRLPLSRLRAADEVDEITEAELAFTPEEQATLGERHGVRPDLLGRYEGWPAMTRLALVAGEGPPVDFLLEEVLSGMPAAERRAVAILAVAGPSDGALLAHLDASIDPATVVERVPLVADLGDGVVRAHDLWTDVLGSLVAPEELVTIGEGVADWHLAAGRPNEAVDAALAGGAWVRARHAVMVATAGGDAALSASRAARWLERFPPELRGEPEVLYLSGVAARLTHGPGHGDEDVAAAMDRFRERGDSEMEAVAALEVGVRAWLANDVGVLLGVLERAQRLIDAGVTRIRGIVLMGDAVATELGGDFRRALEIGRSVEVAVLPTDFSELAIRHTSTMAFLVGEGEIGVGLAEDLVRRNPSARNQFILDVARFQLGDPQPLLDSWEERRNPVVDNQRDDFLLRFFSAMIDASFGRAPDATSVAALAWDRSREHTFVALAEAAAAIVAGDEAGAAAGLRARLDTIGVADPLVLGELRRFIPYSHVLLPELRAELADGLGPTLARRSAVAEALVAARNGQRVAWSSLPPPAEILTALPLPWSLELAARAAAAGDPAGPAIGRYLLDTLGGVAHARLRTLADGHGECRTGATAILATEPRPPDRIVHISVAGPMSVQLGEGPGEHPRRRKVRELLAVLVLRGRTRRAAITDALWPDLDPERARANLSVTLTHLRQLLEPERRRGEPAFHLRQQGDVLLLQPDPSLVVDLWAMQHHIEAAKTLADHGRHDEAVAELSAVASAWVGELLVDLRGVDAFDAEIRGLDRSVADAVATLAEWSLARDDAARAADAAHVLLRHDPHDERAHGVLIGSHLHTGDLTGAQAAADRCEEALASLGVGPSAATRMLLRRLEVRTGARLRAADAS